MNPGPLLFCGDPHGHGFAHLDELARRMGVRMTVHGHHPGNPGTSLYSRHRATTRQGWPGDPPDEVQTSVLSNHPPKRVG